MRLLALPDTLVALLSLILLPTALADVQFTIPAAGAVVDAGTISVSWQESNIAPPITNLGAYSLLLMTGGNNDEDMVRSVAVFKLGTLANGLFGLISWHCRHLYLRAHSDLVIQHQGLYPQA